MTYFISIEEIKQNNVINANVDSEYIEPALREAQDIFLREIIGDALYNAIENKINDNRLTGKYQTLVNQYIKPYLENRMLASLVVPISMKIRNAGVIQQYDQGFNSSSVKDVAYLADYYNGRVEFYENRMTEYLKKNTADIPEYAYSNENITNPTPNITAGTIYLGGSRKRSCGAKMGQTGGGVETVDWDNIINRPDFAEVATSGDYDDLTNTPEIPTVNDSTINIYQGGTLKGSFSLNQATGDDINLDAGGGGGSTDWSDITNKPNFATVATSGDYNDLQNKPTIPTVPTNVSAFNNDAGYLTQHQSLSGYATEQWVENKGYSTFDGDYDSLTNKPTIPTVPTNVSAFNNDAGYTTFDGDYNSLTNKPTIPAAQVQADWQQNDNTAVDYIKNKPSLPSAQIQSDWNQTNSNEVDYIKNKPTIPTVPTNVSAFTNDAGYLTQHQSLSGYATEQWVENKGYTTFDGDYNSLTNKPTIPAAQVQSDWNAVSGMGEILNKPSLATVATTGNYSDLNGTPTIPAAQVNADWNANSGVAEILNKPTIPAAPVQSDWNEADSGSLAYIANKPTIPAAQVNADWNANSGVAQILNKPSIPVVPSYTTETWQFTLSDDSVVTKTVYLVPSV